TPRVLAALVRDTRDLEAAEELLQEAALRALEHWPKSGLPERPGAWLLQVARRAHIDIVRRETRARKRISQHGGLRNEDDDAESGSWDADALVDTSCRDISASDPSGYDALLGVPGDRAQLGLIFACCHPALSRDVQIALALQSVGRLTAAEIARTYRERESAVAQRLVRGKRKIRDAGIRFDMPRDNALHERIGVVLDVIYAIFNEGFLSTRGPSALRRDLCEAAIRMANAIADYFPDELEAQGLAALCALHHARASSRFDAEGRLVPLDDQDRTRWDRELIAAGVVRLQRALARQNPGPYQLQAAIAAIHAEASDAARTDWPQIAALYEALKVHMPTPIVELNSAVAIGLAFDLVEGLRRVDKLARHHQLVDYHLVHAARGELLRRLGRLVDARRAYKRALALVGNDAERAYLERRLRELMQLADTPQ
ncbi:MAG: RNA polymerase subunit sigma-24, partial [Clostridia bacterium]|nr:RNA polymerase subunit sigma-24 [Deltaproteobacteria bacterium]